MKGLLGSKPGPLDSHLAVSAWGRPLPPERQVANEIYYRHPPEDLAGIVRASASFGEPLGKLAETCARYAAFVGEPLGAVPGHHRDHVCTDAELRLLYLQEDEHHWRPVTHPWDVPVVATTAGIGPEEVHRRMAEFAWLGRPIPDPVLAARWAAVSPEVFPVLRRFVVHSDDGRPALPWAATLELAAECDMSLWEAERVLARETEGLGVLHRRRYTKRSSGRDVVPSPDTATLVRWLHQEHIRLEDGVSLRDLAFVRSHETSFEELSWFLDELREAGVDLPDAADLLRAWEGLPTPSRYAFSGENPSWDGADYPVPATSAVLFTAASGSDSSCRSCGTPRIRKLRTSG